MTTPVLLFANAALLSALAGYPLAGARWTRNAPRLAVALWHALCFGVVSSVVLGGVALALPVLPSVVTGGLSDFLARCAMALRTEFAAPQSLLVGIAGLTVATAIVMRLAWSAATSSRETLRVRRGQVDRLALTGRRLRGDLGEDLVLLVDDRPAAYCLPGRGRGTIVVSSGSVDLLADDQLRLVLAHERAHLRQRHHVATGLSATLAVALGWVPLFRLAAREVPLLLEMAADDEAMRSVGAGPIRSELVNGRARRRLAHALVTLASSPSGSPAGTLAVAGSSAVARVYRLSEPPRPLGAGRTSLLSVGVLVASAGPLLVASAPAACAAAMEICPFAFT